MATKSIKAYFSVSPSKKSASTEQEASVASPSSKRKRDAAAEDPRKTDAVDAVETEEKNDCLVVSLQVDITAAALAEEERARAEASKLAAQEKLKQRRTNADVAGYDIESLIPPSWQPALKDELNKPYFRKLINFLNEEEKAGKTIFPPKNLVLNALEATPLDEVKVVIIGQDPYHNPKEAMGLCFSVPAEVKVPSSLRNVYRELASDLKGEFVVPKHGDLTAWAKQGVLLLNASLTVRKNEPNSHSKKGWELFTDAVIQAVNCRRKGVVFMLWGAYAQAKGKNIDLSKHHVMKAAHPSGLSANKGFFGCKHFSKANELLKASGETPIRWQL